MRRRVFIVVSGVVHRVRMAEGARVRDASQVADLQYVAHSPGVDGAADARPADPLAVDIPPNGDVRDSAKDEGMGARLPIVAVDLVVGVAGGVGLGGGLTEEQNDRA